MWLLSVAYYYKVKFSKIEATQKLKYYYWLFIVT